MSSSSEAVRVGVRVRPFNAKENGSDGCLRVDASGTCVTISAPPAVAGSAARRAANAPPQAASANAAAVASSFQFDNVFWSAGTAANGEPCATQEEVYEAMGAPIVAHAMAGFNSCLFAYGQTGSGKTFTMLGDVASDELMGVVPRLCRDLFSKLPAPGDNAGAEGAPKSRWTVELGFVEIYNEQLVDLMAKLKASKAQKAGAKGSANKPGAVPAKAAVIRESPDRGVFIENQTLRPVASPEECLRAIGEASQARHVSATQMNAQSSRSHAIIQLHLVEIGGAGADMPGSSVVSGAFVRPARGTILKRAVINMVDLAGSERTKATGAVGEQLDQAKHINTSLTTLGRVIDALATMSKRRAQVAAGSAAAAKAQATDLRPPYRESKLTYVLKSSLGGNSKTRMIAAVSPSAIQADETLSTLRYASRARDIVNIVQVNEDPLRRRIRELEGEMSKLRTELSQGGSTDYVRLLEERIELLQRDADIKVEQMATAALEHERALLEQQYEQARTDEEREALASGKAQLEAELEEAHSILLAYEADLERMREAQLEREQRHQQELQERDQELERLQVDLAATQRRSNEHLTATIRVLAAERDEKDRQIAAVEAQLAELKRALAAKGGDDDSAASTEKRRALERRVENLTDERSRVSTALTSAESASAELSDAQRSQQYMLQRADVMTLMEREAFARQWLHSAAFDELLQLYHVFSTTALTIQDTVARLERDEIDDFVTRVQQELQSVVDEKYVLEQHLEQLSVQNADLRAELGDTRKRMAAVEDALEFGSVSTSPALTGRRPGAFGTPRTQAPSDTGGAASARRRLDSARGSGWGTARSDASGGRPPLTARGDGDSEAVALLRRLREVEEELAHARVALDVSRDETTELRTALIHAEIAGFDVPQELVHPDYSATGLIGDDEAAGTAENASFAYDDDDGVSASAADVSYRDPVPRGLPGSEQDAELAGLEDGDVDRSVLAILRQ